jgi:hypothetical protein
MNIYKAIRNNFGYLNGYWKLGKTVEAKELPNKHFELVGGESVENEIKLQADDEIDREEKEIIQKRKYNKRRA